jgi:hypothetical protein
MIYISIYTYAYLDVPFLVDVRSDRDEVAEGVRALSDDRILPKAVGISSLSSSSSVSPPVHVYVYKHMYIYIYIYINIHIYSYLHIHSRRG